MRAKELDEPDVNVSGEGQRREKMLAELPGIFAGLAFMVKIKGEGVNKDRLAIAELDVVSAGIFQYHAVGEGLLCN